MMLKSLAFANNFQLKKEVHAQTFKQYLKGEIYC